MLLHFLDRSRFGEVQAFGEQFADLSHEELVCYALNATLFLAFFYSYSMGKHLVLATWVDRVQSSMPASTHLAQILAMQT